MVKCETNISLKEPVSLFRVLTLAFSGFVDRRLKDSILAHQTGAYPQFLFHEMTAIICTLWTSALLRLFVCLFNVVSLTLSLLYFLVLTRHSQVLGKQAALQEDIP